MDTTQKRRPVKQPAAAGPLAADGVIEARAGLEIVVAEKPLRPSECRKHLRKTVTAAYRDIVAGFVNQAKSGSCQHLKMATEVVGAEKREEAESRVKGPAALMLEKLERECG